MGKKKNDEKKMLDAINEIVDICDALDGGNNYVIENFGAKNDLVLNLFKDEDFNREEDPDDWNLVTIVTERFGEVVDDVESAHVTDGSLEYELERIYNYKNFEILESTTPA